ncbi:GTP-binding protein BRASSINAZOLE INSENSITIVE PALE GREEN 2 [Cucumis melo var. makuwa]|uniref:GTP-binding protein BRASSINAZOLE INSENSITIVE PALE GREEN 2 n=1 Tax=Cucumis melo var. makuwa TaxID=1194695 RepID=A0A5D3DDC5_CUCMM|nr:GTP-binding protein BRASSINAZOLE INSENSITIVE PALE GREEN 2 [Cucumis melo var. makuwa]
MLIARKLSASNLKSFLSPRFIYHLSSSPTCSNPSILFPLPSTLFCSFSSKPTPPQALNLSRDGNFDETTSRLSHVCPGCGVHMQDSNPKHPGFFIKPSKKDSSYRRLTHLVPVNDESECSEFLKRGLVIEPEKEKTEEDVIEKPQKPTVCSRCHSLRHYGKVKDPSVENLLPDFDFKHTLGGRLVSTTGTRSVVLIVVDAADFDGSFPKKVANLVSASIENNSAAWKQGKSGNVPRVVLVVTKTDLLPSSLSPTTFERWVRQRAREGGINKITSLHMVSAIKDWGIKNLVEDVIELAGARGNVWAIGAQNAGKSTLINSIGKHVGGKVTHLTEAPVPGTTLGIIRVEGIFPEQAKLFDTPGLLNPHQITTRLTREEQKLVHISKELKPRTYRIKVGHTIHVAGLMRLDVDETNVDTIYVTVWASPYLPLHMGKTENATKIREDHFGIQLQPPIGKDRVAELGKWVRKEFRVCGTSWDSSCVDAAAAGLGWFSIGLKGEAVLSIWTYEGVEIVLRSSVIPDRANFFEDAGFTVSKIVSKADQAANKQLGQSEKKKKGDPKVHMLAKT